MSCLDVDLEITYDPKLDGFQPTLFDTDPEVSDNATLDGGSNAEYGVRVPMLGKALDVEIFTFGSHHRNPYPLEIYPLDGMNRPVTVWVIDFDFSEAALVGATQAALAARQRLTAKRLDIDSAPLCD